MSEQNKDFSDLMSHEEYLQCIAAIRDGKILSPVATGLFEQHPHLCKICQNEAKKKRNKK